MALTISLLFFVLLISAVGFFGYRIYAKPVRFHERLGEAAIVEQSPTLTRTGTEHQWIVRVVQKVGEAVPISPQDAGMARRLLMAAGYRSETAVKVYYGLKVVLGIALFLLALYLRRYIENPVGSIVILPGGALGGYFLPNLLLDRKISTRHEKLRFSLPDALDLMVVCMEAGLGLDQAINAVSRELALTHPEIADELSLVTLEMRAGKRRMEALRNLADRTAEPELRKLVATMIQADRFGTSVAESLRTHSEFMRVRRRQEAEERAAKIGVKLVFPIFFFILPAMLVVAAGPGLLQLFKNLFPLMRGYR